MNKQYRILVFLKDGSLFRTINVDYKPLADKLVYHEIWMGRTVKVERIEV